VVQWFDLGGEVKIHDSQPSREVWAQLETIQGLPDKLGALGLKQKERAEMQVAAAEFVLEGLHAHKRIGRNEERLFTAGEKGPKRVEQPPREEPPMLKRRPYN